MITIKTILGDRLLIRRTNPRQYIILPRPCYGDLTLPEDSDQREPAFEAQVIAIGTAPSENINVGDMVILAAPPSQDRVGTRKALWNGEPCELVSTLDVVAIVLHPNWQGFGPTMCGDPIGSGIKEHEYPEKYAREYRGKWI